MLVKDKVVLITGCSRGIGYEMMKRFVEEGALVYANARENGVLDDAVRESQSRIRPLYFDVTDRSGCEEAVAAIKKDEGRIDVLINNAGFCNDCFIELVNEEALRKTFDINVFSVIFLTKCVVKMMKRKKHGSIINISSVVGVYGNEGQTSYSASKGAVVALTRTWAKEFSRSGIRVNCIAPGYIDTDLFNSIGEQKVNEAIDKVRLQRVGTPREIADPALFLASEMSSYITGQVLCVDGGLY